jgi:hypothetical protein
MGTADEGEGVGVDLGGHGGQYRKMKVERG